MSSDEDKRDKTSQFAYLDLLATTLTEHEKNLDGLIERLEKVSESLAEIGRLTEVEEPAEVKKKAVSELPETLIFIKMKINRPTEELKIILDSLKE